MDPLAAPQLIITCSAEAAAVLPALDSWGVAPSTTDMHITLLSHVVTLATQDGNAAISCRLQVVSTMLAARHGVLRPFHWRLYSLCCLSEFLGLVDVAFFCRS